MRKKAKQAFLNTLIYIVLFFYDVNLTISLLDRPITAEINKGVFDEYVNYQHSLFVNNLKNNHYVTNYSTNNRSVSTNDQLNNKTNHLINY